MTDTPTTPTPEEELDRVLSGEAEHLYITPKEARYLAAVDAVFTELDDIRAFLNRVDEAYERRLLLYFTARKLGVTLEAIAGHTDSTDNAVRGAMDKARQQVAAGTRKGRTIDPAPVLREISAALTPAIPAAPAAT